jgi:hypothetical protein
VLWLPLRAAGVTERTPRPPALDPLAAGTTVPS